MILNGAENGKNTGMILMDRRKVFDTLDHKMLLDKMKCISFSSQNSCILTSRVYIETFIVSALYKCYADDTINSDQHKDITKIKNVLSKIFYRFIGHIFPEARIINCGVPQESILRPLLFSLYKNDLRMTLAFLISIRTLRKSKMS